MVGDDILFVFRHCTIGLNVFYCYSKENTCGNVFRLDTIQKSLALYRKRLFHAVERKKNNEIIPRYLPPLNVFTCILQNKQNEVGHSITELIDGKLKLRY